jgi:hypothetical protein
MNSKAGAVKQTAATALFSPRLSSQVSTSDLALINNIVSHQHRHLAQ